MSTTMEGNVTVGSAAGTRLLREGYGPGAWHGPDLKAAIADTAATLAFWRPAAGRHNIAEISLHHAFCVRNVRAQLSGQAAEPFVLPGEDWFEVSDGHALSWDTVRATVDLEQQRLADLVAAIESGAAHSPLAPEEQVNLILGITAHAIYHAGQIQLIRRLSTTA